MKPAGPPRGGSPDSRLRGNDVLLFVTPAQAGVQKGKHQQWKPRSRGK